MTSIAFIMPTFNRAEYIAEAIGTIVSQMRPQDTLTVVDDGGQDDTETVVRALGLDLKFMRQKNSGKSVALNLALANTQSDYVWICDDDDLLCPGVVEKFVETIEINSADVVFGRYTRFCMEDGKQVDMGTGYWPDLSKGTINRHILEDVFIHHNATLARRRVYEEAGLFDPVMLRSQDYAMYVKLALTCKFSYVDEVAFLQRQHTGVRGPKSQLHDARKTNSVWQKFDKLIFEPFRSDIPLSYFESFYTHGEGSEITRAALLQRACMFGRHGLWAYAIDDLEAAAALAAEKKLNRVEAEICSRMVAGKYGLSGLVVDEIRDRLRQFRKQSDFGESVVIEMANGVLWRLRAKNEEAKRDARTFLKQFAGYWLGLPLLNRRFNPIYAVSNIVERRDFQVPVSSSQSS